MSLPIQDQSSSKKSRRAKPHIELAPGQPLTTQGKPRARVYVACVQCRTRKIRCDGAKPVCHNCTRHAKPSDPCMYDAAPKRRGPDKTPGARQRMTREAHQGSDTDPVTSRRRRRKTHDSPTHTSSPPLVLDPQLTNMPQLQPAPVPLPSLVGSEPLMSNSLPALPGNSPHNTSITASQSLHNMYSLTSYSNVLPPATSLIGATTSHGYITPYKDTDTDTSEESSDILCEPSLDFTRKTWWDSLIAMYSFSFTPQSFPTAVSPRQQAANQITNDLRFFFRSSNYWVSFINVPRFFSIYFDPASRARLQPSLLPAALAIATFFQSSDAGFGKQGRRKAMQLRDLAQGALEASFNAQWIDEELAQAAWVSRNLGLFARLTTQKLLSLFEICSHPDYSSERCSSALGVLDGIIRTLSLTSIDINDPASSIFLPRSVPAIMAGSQSWTTSSSLDARVSNVQAIYPSPQGCSCLSRTLGQHWSAAKEYTPLWLNAPAWDSSWTEAEIRKETCRRLCWSTVQLMAGHTTYVTSINRRPSDYFAIEPANFAILFPGEALLSSNGDSGKDVVWAINYRTSLLWHSCLKILQYPGMTTTQIAQFGLDAWLEADALEAALNSHGCDLERSFLFQGRESLFNVRMMVTYEFQRYAPHAYGDVTQLFRTKAKEWLIHQAGVAQRVVQSLGSVTGHASQALLHRPFFVFWFMGQISRALCLWERDNSLTLALDVGTTLFKPVDYLSLLWPCPEQRYRSRVIRERLAAACRKAGRPMPPPGPGEYHVVSNSC